MEVFKTSSEYNLEGINLNPKTDFKRIYNNIKEKNPNKNFVLCTDCIYSPFYDPDMTSMGETMIWNEDRLYSVTPGQIIKEGMGKDLYLHQIQHPITNKYMIRIFDTQYESTGEEPLHLKTLTGKSLTIRMDLAKTAMDLKKAIYEKEKIDISTQRLISTGGFLVDDAPLLSQNVTAESTIHIVIRLRGGMHMLQNGHIDYCSIKAPRGGGYDRGVCGVEKQIRYIDANGEIKNLQMIMHPNATTSTVKTMIQIETDPEYFSKLSIEQFENIGKFIENMSEGAIERYMVAYGKFD